MEPDKSETAAMDAPHTPAGLHMADLDAARQEARYHMQRRNRLREDVRQWVMLTPDDPAGPDYDALLALVDATDEPGITYGGDGFELKITSGPLLEGWTLLDRHGNVVASAVFPGLSDAP